MKQQNGSWKQSLKKKQMLYFIKYIFYWIMEECFRYMVDCYQNWYGKGVRSILMSKGATNGKKNMQP